jgi:hypothetical protein
MSLVGRLQGGAWLSPLLGLVLLVIAGTDLALCGGIGWEATQRAALSQQLVALRALEQGPLRSPQGQVNELGVQAGASEERRSTGLSVLPSHDEIVVLLARLRSDAEAQGLRIVELNALASTPATVPAYRFLVRAQGNWPQLLAFLLQAADACDRPAACLEEVRLQADAVDQGEITFQLTVLARPAAASAAGSASRTKLGSP